MEKKTKYKAAFLTLGCRVNQYESNAIAEALKKLGVESVGFGEDADVCVINTCSVTAESDRKSRQMIRRAVAKYKGKPVVVCGCYAQNPSNSLSDINGIALICGNGEKSKLPAMIFDMLSGKETADNILTDMSTAAYDTLSFTTPLKERSFIKIEDGCENKCAYCIIPSLRGKVRSREKESVISEARTLIAAGAQEIVLTGIETASYGKDFDCGYHLIDLISDIDALDGAKRITLGSLEPTIMTDEFAKRISSLSSVLPHFHVSLQSGSSGTLRRMRRRYNASQAEQYISNIRKYMPDVTLSADIIIGFPGETDDEFNETVEFIKRNRFLHLHIFPYSKRSGTEAASMPSQIPDKVKHDRVAYITEVQREIKESILDEYCEAHRDNPARILFEQTKDGVALGHTDHNVDIILNDCSSDMSGKLVLGYAVGRCGNEIQVKLK